MKLLLLAVPLALCLPLLAAEPAKRLANDLAEPSTLLAAPGEAAIESQAKAFGNLNRDLLFTRLPPCRLIDTRGYGAPIQGGAFFPGSRRSYAPNGLCLLPGAGVSAILVGITTQNLTPQSGGYIAMVSPNAPITASVDIFNLGSEWSQTSAIVVTQTAAQFDILVAQATAHVVVDVLGYYSPPTPGVVGTADIADGAITNSKLAAGALPAATIISTAFNSLALPPGSGTSVNSPQCPSGRVLVSGNCSTNSSNAVLVESVSTGTTWRCYYLNKGTLEAMMHASANCMATPAAAK